MFFTFIISFLIEFTITSGMVLSLGGILFLILGIFTILVALFTNEIRTDGVTMMNLIVGWLVMLVFDISVIAITLVALMAKMYLLGGVVG